MRDNPADHVKLPCERIADSGAPGVVDEPDMFLTADQASALVAARPRLYSVLTPWPRGVA